MNPEKIEVTKEGLFYPIPVKECTLLNVRYDDTVTLDIRIVMSGAEYNDNVMDGFNLDPKVYVKLI